MTSSSFGPLAAALSVMLFAQSTMGFWRLPCNTPLIYERVDPIVNLGAVSGHVHAISGASNLGPNTTFADLRASDCTSCLVPQDLSAYWTPALYFQWANGTLSPVKQVGGGLIYYLQRYHPSDTTKVLAFPDGHKMLVGNPFLRSYTPSRMAEAIGWNCLGSGTTGHDLKNPYLPTTTCSGNLRAELRFPSCWDGVNVDSSDHISHMAYSDGESGPCPSTHPNRVATLFFEISWYVQEWDQFRSQAKNTTQPFVLAMGDASGFGLHADFFNGWDRPVLQQALDECRDDSGVIELCKVFDLQSRDATCKKTPDVNEIVQAPLAALPGCNPITGFGPNATPCKADTTPEIFTSPKAYTGKAQPPGTQVLATTPRVLESHDVWVYKDCYSDDSGNRALSKQLTTTKKTVEACLDACKASDFSMCGIEYHGQCWGGNQLSGGSKALGYGFCDLTCDDNSLQYCGGSNPIGFELYVRGTAPVSTTPSTSTAATSRATTATPTTSASTTSVSTTSRTSVFTSASTVGQTSSPTSAKPTSTSPTTTASSVTTTPTPSQAAGKLNTSKWGYSGCFSDLVPGRSLPNLLNSNSTVEGCLAAADTAGFAVAGLSYSGECWAAGALSPASTALDASRCQMACKNAALQTCGGAAALDVYISKSTAVLKTPTTPDLVDVSGYSFTGCYSDLVNGQRTLSRSLSSNSTIEGCVAACSKAGFAFCGLEYYGECYGGATLASSGAQIDASKCTFACKNNPLQNCGGSAALSVYSLKVIVPFSATNLPAELRGRNLRERLDDTFSDDGPTERFLVNSRF